MPFHKKFFDSYRLPSSAVRHDSQLRFVESFLNHHDVSTLAAMVQSKSKVDAEADRVIADLRTCHDELKQKLENEALEVEVSR